MEASTGFDRAALIEKIVRNGQALYAAGYCLKRVTAEGFLFASDEALLKVERIQDAAMAKVVKAESAA